MIRDGQTAQRALELMDKAHRALMESLELVRSTCPDEEYEAYRSGVAQVDGRLFFLLMEPIYCQHPALIPPGTPSDFVEKWTRNRTPSDLDPGTK